MPNDIYFRNEIVISATMVILVELTIILRNNSYFRKEKDCYPSGINYHPAE